MVKYFSPYTKFRENLKFVPLSNIRTSSTRTTVEPAQTVKIGDCVVCEDIAVSNMEKSSQIPTSPPRRPSSPRCSICLDEVKKISCPNSCLHNSFCFTCLLEWSRTKRTCPLCRRRFIAILSDDHYESYRLPVEPPPAPMPVDIPLDPSLEEVEEEEEEMALEVEFEMFRTSGVRDEEDLVEIQYLDENGQLQADEVVEVRDYMGDDDDSDSNSEDNWRNDYPEEDDDYDF